MALANNLLSDGQLLIDFSGNGGSGLRKIGRATSFDDSNARAREPVQTIGMPGASGMRRTKGGGTVSLDILMEEGVPEVDWIAMDLDNAIFAMRYVPDGGGKAITYFGCEVANASPKLNADGNNTFSVSIAYRSRR